LYNLLTTEPGSQYCNKNLFLLITLAVPDQG